MSIIANISAFLKVEGLSADLAFRKQFVTTATPTAATHQRRTLGVADTAEALDLGDVSTVEYIVIYADTNSIDIDCDFDSAFDADIEIPQGEVAMFKPAGTVYIKNHDAGQAPVYEYTVIGTT